jgi:hypothetical protein
VHYPGLFRPMPALITISEVLQFVYLNWTRAEVVRRSKRRSNAATAARWDPAIAIESRRVISTRDDLRIGRQDYGRECFKGAHAGEWSPTRTFDRCSPFSWLGPSCRSLAPKLLSAAVNRDNV